MNKLIKIIKGIDYTILFFLASFALLEYNDNDEENFYANIISLYLAFRAINFLVKFLARTDDEPRIKL